MKYKINYQGISEDFTTFYFSVISETPKNLTFIVYNTYFGSEEYRSSSVFAPNIQYWNYIVTNHQHRYVEFLDNETGKVVGQFTLPGKVNYFDFDYNSYVKKVYKLLTENEKKVLITVMNEVVCRKVYSNYLVDIEENDTVVDIGFNYGIFSTTALVKNPKKIIAFEPNYKLCNIFKSNFYDERIRLVNSAVSDCNKTATFYENESSVMNTIKDDLVDSSSSLSYQVEVIGINDVIRKYNLDKIDYLKVDCEGSEYEIFDSIPEDYLSNNIKKIAIEFHSNINDPKVTNMRKKLNLCGFNTHDIYDGGDVGMMYAKKI